MPRGDERALYMRYREFVDVFEQAGMRPSSGLSDRARPQQVQEG
jgi:hypothetical protein